KVRGDQPHHIDVEDLPVLTTKGNMPSIKISKKAVERGRLYYKYCPMGRLDFNKIKLDEVRSIAATMWRPQGDWKIIPLEEADKLLNGNWVDQGEEEEWQVETKKGYKHQWQNVRGMKRQGPWHFIEELVLEHNPCFLCIAEPLIKPPTVLPPLFSRLGLSSNFLHNDTPPRVGNLWLFWKDELTVDHVNVSHQQITVKVGNFLISFLHANSSYGTQRGLWQELGSLGNTVDAWAVVGDSNILSSVTESREGRSPCINAMNEFNSFIHSNALLDSTTCGFKYSWCNKRWGNKRML
ncbi:hypothetical protein IFM89_035325, partial [Coptis chinensis]